MDERDPDPPPERGEQMAAFPGQEWLRGGSPKEVLHKLLDHDPFELQGRVVARLEERAYLLSEHRVYLRSLARIAYAALGYHGEPPLEEWLRGRIDVSMDEIQGEEVEAELQSAPLEVPPEPHHDFVSQRFGVEPWLARRACIRFNALPDRARRAFFAIAVHKKTVNRYVAEGNGPPTQVQADFEAALRALASFPDPDQMDLWGTTW